MVVVELTRNLDYLLRIFSQGGHPCEGWDPRPDQSHDLPLARGSRRRT